CSFEPTVPCFRAKFRPSRNVVTNRTRPPCGGAAPSAQDASVFYDVQAAGSPPMISAPQLLVPAANLRLNTRALNETLTFAFATGGTGEGLERILDETPVGPSLWKAECFAQDLFLDEFVKRCLATRIDGAVRKFHPGHLRRVLSHPPAEFDTVLHRQRILDEL